MIRPPPWARRCGSAAADELDGAGQVGGDDVVDLGVGEFFGGAEQAVAGVADDHVDAAELGERVVDDVADGDGVGDVEDRGWNVCGYRSSRSLTLPVSRTVPTTRSPRSRSCSVSSRPKPLLTPVMSQVRGGHC